MMRLLTVALVVSLITSSTVVFAQNESVAGPIARAAALEANRLATEPRAANNLALSELSGTSFGSTRSRNMMLGVIIGAGAGAAVGYAVGSRCGPGTSPDECRGDGELVAVVFAGLGAAAGALLVSHIQRP
jgi:hypothetical protein